MTTKKQKETQEVPSWAIYAGIGATVLAAGLATAYIVKRKRDEELQMMRLGGGRAGEANLDDFSNKGVISTYWTWTVQAFGKVNRFVTHLLKSPANDTPLRDDELAAYGMSSSDQEIQPVL